MNENQRRILSEAAKFGGRQMSAAEKMANTINEQQEMIGKYLFKSFVEGSIKGWLISMQGKGEIGFIEAPAKKNTRTSMAPHTIFFNKGSSPKKVCVAWSDNATRIVSEKEVRYAPRQLLKAVAMWMDKHGAAMVESVEDVSESATKAALEDFMYSLPKAAIAELKPIFKKKINPMSVTAGVMRLASVTAILKKHKVAPKFMDMNSAKVVNDFFDTFFGESVEEDGEATVSEARIHFKRILQGVKDSQGPFTVVVMKASGPGALMQKKVSTAAAIPAHVNYILGELKGKPWKAIAIEQADGGVVNVLFPKDVQLESVEEATVSEQTVPVDKRFTMRGSTFKVRKSIGGDGYDLFIIRRGGSVGLFAKLKSLERSEVLKAAEAANRAASPFKKEETEDGELVEAPAVAMPVGGYSKPQFESRMRELIRKMGFEKGITNIRSEGTKMIVCFALAPKARDFMATINGLMRMRAKGNVATIDTNFNRIKAPAGTTAIVTLDFSKVQQEAFEEEFLNHLALVIESGGAISEAYIKAEDIKAIRNDLKKTFPAFKFAVSRSQGSSGSINVYILSGPMKFRDTDGDINHYHPGSYKNADTLKKIIAVINKKNYDNSDSQSDYFDVGFYLHLAQGRYSWRGSKKTEKGFVLTDKTGKKPLDPAQEIPTAEQVEISEKERGFSFKHLPPDAWTDRDGETRRREYVAARKSETEAARKKALEALKVAMHKVSWRDLRGNITSDLEKLIKGASSTRDSRGLEKHSYRLRSLKEPHLRALGFALQDLAHRFSKNPPHPKAPNPDYGP